MEPLKITSFDELTQEQARQILAAGSTAIEESRWKFYQGDHWQDGEGWVGPRLPPGDAAATEVLAEIERSFIYWNVSREISDRHADAVTNREPRWGVVLQRVLKEDEDPTEQEAARIGELDGLMTNWWDSPLRGTYTDPTGQLHTCSVHGLLQQFARRYIATGRANLRIFIPPAHVQNGTLPKKPLADALSRVFVELCEPAASSVYTDRRRMQQIGVYLWREGDAESGGTEYAEFSYLADDGSTILRQVQKSNESSKSTATEGEVAPVQVPSFNLGGNLLHFEASGNGLLSDSLIAQQKDLNRTLTMGGRAMNLSGFPERVLFDVQLDGEYVDDPQNPGKKKFIPSPPALGAGTINNFQGIEYQDDEGKIQRSKPSYQRLDPPGTRIFDEAADAAARRMRDEAKQSHVEMSSDATASGRSREQARWEFVQSLADTVAAVNNAGRWLLTTALMLGIATSTDGGMKFDGLRFEFACRIDPGPLSSLERAEDRAQVAAGLLSKETAMTRSAVDDTDAENSRISGEEESSLTAMEQRARITQVLSAAGAGIQAAAIVAGFDAEQAAQLGRSDFVEGDEDSGAPAGDVNPANLKAGIAADKTLNGAQINAALDVIDRLTGGTDGEGVKIASVVAIELLAAVGLPRETASLMVNNSK